ncbi:MAG: hypothetical protein JO280_13465 [Mycobacteriaceae bacterium]|nr:hypothetical protein [Mycobacteriaceae bacterium]
MAELNHELIWFETELTRLDVVLVVLGAVVGDGVLLVLLLLQAAPIAAMATIAAVPAVADRRRTVRARLMLASFVVG